MRRGYGRNQVAALVTFASPYLRPFGLKSMSVNKNIRKYCETKALANLSVSAFVFAVDDGL